eukprot:461277_1
MGTKKSGVDSKNREYEESISPVLFWSMLPADGIENVQLQALASLVSDSENSDDSSSVVEEEENDRASKMEEEEIEITINNPSVDNVPSSASRMIGHRRHGCSTSARLKRRKVAGPYDIKTRSYSRPSASRRATKGEAQVLLSMLQM